MARMRAVPSNNETNTNDPVLASELDVVVVVVVPSTVRVTVGAV